MAAAYAVPLRRGQAARALCVFVTMSQGVMTRGYEVPKGGTEFPGSGGMYEPPAPICPAFSCPAGQVAVGKESDHQLWSYGCKDSGMNMFNMANFDPKNPMAGMGGQKNLNKCCVERDICRQTCGMTSKACHALFQKCQNKICKNDQNCRLQAMVADITDPEPDEDKDEKYDFEKQKCAPFTKAQKAACQCVPKADFKSSTEKKLKKFYARFNSGKLDKKGEIKDVADVWKKWKGKEPDMFMALATKYKEKAVEMRAKPKPKPYKPPPAKAGGDDLADAGNTFEEPEPEKPAEPEPVVDPEEAAFKEKRVVLLTKKRTAVEDEDYDAADEAKEALEALIKEEQERLGTKKKQAIDDEDFIEAKKIKQRIAKLSEL